jgi:hypothetical protein
MKKRWCTFLWKSCCLWNRYDGKYDNNVNVDSDNRIALNNMTTNRQRAMIINHPSYLDVLKQRKQIINITCNSLKPTDKQLQKNWNKYNKKNIDIVSVQQKKNAK